ncbi:uncharacterized protein Z520_11340 [Fonsecaea multimorphosa CBS 102226]|uniref:Peptidase A1 domain-containing protein n=1 Tax=Fonsecaea multimorphosa CBS 102226 TaxID=1442371 RepID=A0A0D2JQW8_9EURO|nr:uncharacterized protein Z520_11340 [Fonsecaea multimorphosa CBS 102226]KIX92864.1 hypothetical protein Z520_11340 [Fonsecaea multimorphosa CBS 102226]OAL18116.1 hypothetical protein AYO22_10893 [Fonsecaea multimorphosa]
MRSSNHIRSMPFSWSCSSDVLIVFGLILSLYPVEASEPAPIVATTSTDFFGYDGSWSAISIRVGSPEQYLSVFPSTLGQETWVVGPAGCDGTSICENKRGGLFSANESSSFKARGFYELNFDPQLGGTGDGYYGLDTLSLNDAVSVPDQIVSVVNSTEYWVGTLGLGVQQTRFSGSEAISPLLSSLIQKRNDIPSRSYGYTAGAVYRLKSVPASLTFGGIDANRFVPNDMSFTLSQDYSPIVAINSISVSSGAGALPSNWDSNPQTLLDMSQADLFTIDSSTPFLWLPESACNAFANALNLTYDDTLQLYLFPSDSSSSPTALSAWNLTFTFALSNLPGSSNEIVLTLPYDAFNLQLTYPFPNLAANFTSPPTNYFPLRKAANSTQYTIGRAFLQETYLAVDYERNNFSISQAVFTLDAVSNVNLLAISRPADSTWPGPPAAGGLSTGAKIGIGVGAGIGALLAMALALWFCLRKRGASGGPGTEKEKRRSLLSRLQRNPDSKTSVSELLGDKRQPTEVPADPSVSRFELSGHTPIEMPAGPVSPSFFEGNDGPRRGSALMRNDPRRPAELEHQHSSNKAAEAAAAASERSGSPVPPYSPAEINHRFSASVSPYSVRHSRAFGTVSSDDQGISPVGASHSRRSSNTNSRSMSSPISPEVASRSQAQLLLGESTSPTTSTSHGSLLVPQLNGRPPSRSPSSGSRFVEEGLGTVTEERPAGPPARKNPPEDRFSWEQ